ncbi:sugar transferase [Spongiivirga citrea]|uniref:Sugar transferase n=1 Tax=Spongiivirga citrea TaxID=1481457 RepID=A0A6M0CGA3_9FLAO|nr:sugar transferase [Spongiivirga citrea]NER16885.1 sugar transferase [Spongiivirga citrea]
MYKLFIKRLIDILGALVLLIVFSPILLVVSVVLIFAIKGTPFFTQRRPGKNEEIFSVVKFKSMTDEKDENGELLPDHTRLTKIGKFIRKTSLDELPQLFNVLKGDMSFIGPRPLLIRYLPYYTQEEKTRHSIRPGITGLAQVSGRNFLNWDERLAKDAFYVKNLSFLMDVKIVLTTIKNVITSKDVSVDAFLAMGYLDEERQNKEIEGEA